MKKLLALVLIVGLALFLVGCKSSTSNASPTPTTATSGTWDLAKLFSSTGSYKCTAKVQTSQGPISMEIWIKDAKERIEVMAPQGKNIALYTGSMMYSWLEGRTQGAKMDLSKLSTQQQTSTGVKTVSSMNQNALDINCVQQEVPDSLLTPPSDIQFTDMNEMLSKAQGLGANIQTA